MIELLKQHISSGKSVEHKINLLRELLQLLCLKILYDKGYFSKMAFIGGTALRVLYDLRRFSEDLDFSLIDKKGYAFSNMISVLDREFKLNGLETVVKVSAAKTVQQSMLKFPGLLKIMGLSELEKQNLSIKIEVDSNPPKGWHIENTLINRIYMLDMTHFDLPSLYATKLHACFFRRYVKGRDFYDFVWYLGRKARPNYTLLNNAIEQTHGRSLNLNESNIKEFLLEKVAKIDFDNVKKDVERFLEDKNELRLLKKDTISNGIIQAFL